MADQNLNIGIKVTSDTAGAKQATAAIDGVDKAVADLAKTEKEAINTNGMYLDSLGRIHDASGRFVKVAAEEREGLKERIKVQQQDTVTTTGAVQAKKELGKANSNAAMGVLALSNAFQDAQYGMAGMINNIPMMVTGLGLGMGVAGAVQAAAVGIQILSKNVDLFGEKAKQAARDAADLASEAMADADAAYKVAAAMNAATEAQDRHNDAMQAADDRYKEQIRLSEDLLRQKQAERDAVIAMTDAQAGLDMAKIQLAEGRGEMSKEDAIIAREKVRSEAEARKQASNMALEQARRDALMAKTQAELKLSGEFSTQASTLREEGAGMMTKEDRALAEANKKSAQDQLESSRLRREALAKTITQERRVASSQLADIGFVDKREMLKRLAENRAKLAKETEEAAKLQADINREDQKLKKDKEARLKTGVKDGDAKDLEKAVEAKEKERKSAWLRFQDLDRQQMDVAQGMRDSGRLFDVRQQTGATQAQAQVEAEQRRRREEAKREEDRARDQKDRDDAARARELKQVGAAGGSLASTLAGDGLAPGFADSLREAAGGAGSDAGLNRLIAMVAKLTANSSKLSEQAKSKLDKLEAEIEDLRTAK